jgi:hypothetical protein
VLIRAPLQKAFGPLVRYLEIEGTKVCERIAKYSETWKQSINVGKTVAQVFYSQVKKPEVDIFMQGQKLETVSSFKYLGFTWTSKLSLKPAVNRCLDNIHKSLSKLRWLRAGRTLSKEVLRRCFFAYTFPHFAWIFPFFPFLPCTQQDLLRSKFRVAIRLIHRAPFVSAANLLAFTHEVSLDLYGKRYIVKRPKNIHLTDLGSSLFLEDVCFWDNYNSETCGGIGQYFRLRRVNKPKANHLSLLLKWLEFAN